MVAVETVPDGPTLFMKCVIQHSQDNVTVLKWRKRAEGLCQSKDAAGIREKRRDFKYRRRENDAENYRGGKSVHTRKTTN